MPFLWKAFVLCSLPSQAHHYHPSNSNIATEIMHHFLTSGSPRLTTHPPSSLPCSATRKHAYPLHKTLPHLPFIYQIKSTRPGLAAKAFYRPAQITLTAFSLPIFPNPLPTPAKINNQITLCSPHMSYADFHISPTISSIWKALPRLAEEKNHQGNFF